MKAIHARPRPARRRAVRAFVLTFWVTAVVLAGVLAGLVADVRTRRVCDGDRAEGMYTHLADSIRPPLPDLSAPEPTEPTDPEAGGWAPYPLRLLRAFAEALIPLSGHPDAVAVMAAKP